MPLGEILGKTPRTPPWEVVVARFKSMRAPTLRIIALVGLFGTLISAGTPEGGVADHTAIASSTQPARPNIVFILTDDQDVATVRFMPRVQTLLAAEGLTFTNTFATQPLCCPSRASILRGQYAHNTEIVHNAPPLGGFQKFRDLGHEESTLATWLQRAGYHTAMFGKYLNGYLGRSGQVSIPPGWSEWHGADADPVTYYNQQIDVNGEIVTYGSNPSDYHTDVLTEKVIAFLERRDRNAPPFFIYLSGPAPHCDCMANGPATPAPRHLGAFADLSAPRGPSFNEVDVSDKPPEAQLPLLSEERIAELDDEYRTRLGSLLAVDEAVERIIGVLRARGELDNTFIFFTSDNGYHLGEHRVPRGKNTLYEESIRVPGIVRGPGVPAGLMREHFVLNIDFAPTFAELAGAPIPDFVDGRSLVPLLRQSPPPARWRQDFLIEVTNPPGITDLGLRTSHHAYFEFASGATSFYDLREDPHQVNSLHNNTEPGLIRALSARLTELAVCTGRSCHD
jgi:N-acetylglucosamine-6-sulfatase